MVRVDHPDEVFRTRQEKEDALVEEIRSVHAGGQPILVGTGSVEESERLSLRLRGIHTRFLNARNDAVEQPLWRVRACSARSRFRRIWRAGTDIQLGEVSELGGLYVIGPDGTKAAASTINCAGALAARAIPGVHGFSFLSKMTCW